MAKKIFYDDDARARVQAGAKALYDAVKVTYGPKGRNVVITKGYGSPSVTHDGVTVAEAVQLPEDTDEVLGFKAGAELIKQAAKNLNHAAGDGTTTVTVLTYSILAEANRLSAAGHNPMEVRGQIEAAAAAVVDALDARAEVIDENSPRVAEIAAISAGDAELGKTIADVISKVGKDGFVTVEAGQGLSVETEIAQGYTIDKGWVSPFFVTDPNRQEAIIEDASIIIVDTKITTAAQILPLIEKLVQAGRKSFVFVAEATEAEALQALIFNKLKGAIQAVAINAPSYGDRRTELLTDLSAFVGATFISQENGHTLETAAVEMVGQAKKVVVSKDSATFIGGNGGADVIAEQLALIQGQLENAPDDFSKQWLNKRAATLAGKVAVIKVGGATETEIDEKKYRVDDAVAATKAALAEGIVAGGGVTLVNIATSFKADAITTGHQIVINALKQPFLQIMENAGLNGAALLPQVEAADGMGVNVNDPAGGLIDVKAAGVIDPVRVTKEAVRNAASIAATAATMGALIVDLPNPEVGEQTAPSF